LGLTNTLEESACFIFLYQIEIMDLHGSRGANDAVEVLAVPAKTVSIGWENECPSSRQAHQSLEKIWRSKYKELSFSSISMAALEEFSIMICLPRTSRCVISPACMTSKYALSVKVIQSLVSGISVIFPTRGHPSGHGGYRAGFL